MNTATQMTDSPSSEELSRLRALVPLHTLPGTVFNELVDEIRIESATKGQVLFQKGDTDNENVYLLEGRVCLLDGHAVAEQVRAGSDTARFPLAHQLPRQFSVRADSKARIARVDSRRLSDLLARAQKIDYQVADFDAAEQDDWMSLLLQSPILQQVPAANIQQVMMNIEQVEHAKGDDLIRQGDPGDYYYMLTRGRAVVRRDGGDGNGPSELATLGPGDTFGEEALLSDSPRNSSVSMLQDGEVLRLSKEHFLQLIHNPLLDQLSMHDAQSKVDEGAIWLDLRSCEQYDESHLPGAINSPFESLRYQAASLAPDRQYVLCSNSGGRAMAGAFLLAERGFDVSVLRGGLRQQSQEASRVDSAPAEKDEVDDAAAQARIREAEARAIALESRLQEIERDQESAAQEREQHLQKVSEAVDKAKRKLVETEAQKHEALAAEQKAYAEMEQLTGSLEELESERASLRDRMSEIEGLDQHLQKRLAKAERELIGERERAESATSSFEELSQRLAEAAEMREEERGQHARELGELKEEMTALQVELEQSRLDIAELREKLAERLVGATVADAQASDLQQRVAEAKQLQDTLQAERDNLQAEVAALQSRLEQQHEQQHGEHKQQRAALDEQQVALQDECEALRAELAQQAGDHEQREAKSDKRLAAVQAGLDNAVAQRESAQRDLDEARTQLATLEAELGQLQGQLRSGQAAGDELERVRAKLGDLEQQHAEREQELVRARQELQQLQADKDQLETKSSEEGSIADEAAAMRVEIEELKQRLEGREQALTAAQEEQAELIEALNNASAAREALQLAANDKESEQARLVDLENQVAEALRMQQSDLLAHEQERHRLQEQLAEGAQQHSALQEEFERFKQLCEAADLEDGANDSQLQTECAALRSELEQRDNEVESLRAVIEEHVEQIRAAQSNSHTDVTDASEVAALRAELEMVREQAIRDVAEVRAQFAAADTQKRRMQQADEREAISHEAMRQRIEALESSLAERQRLLAEADESRHMLEDSMEDANQKVDNLSRELEKAQVEADEAIRGRRELENARDQLQQALYQLQEDAEEQKVTDLRDERLTLSKRPIGIDSVAARPRHWLSAMLGAGLLLATLEAISFLTDHGELFAVLLRLSE